MASYRRYRPNKKNTNHTLPIAAIGITAAALLMWGIYAKGNDILLFFKGQTIVVPSNKEANDNLNRLLNDLAGDKADLLELAEHSQTRLGWIDNVDTRRQFRWFLMSRLVDKGQWEEAVKILPEVESLAPPEGLDRLAQAAAEHGDYDLQLRLDQELQAKVANSPTEMKLFLRSIRRYAETCIRMQRNDAAVQAIARMDAPAIIARMVEPELAAEAAELQMMRANVCEVKEPVLQMVRNLLEQAKWPLCPATSQLMLEEVSTALRDNPNIPEASLKEIEAKLVRCRDAMLAYPDKERRLPECYMLLGELRYRLKNYEGCAEALSLAAAFAEGYGEMTPDMQVKLRRVSSRANEARGAVAEAMMDCRYLLEHEKDANEAMRCLTFLATHAQGEEKIALLMQCWDKMQQNPALAQANPELRSQIISELSAYYTGKEDFNNAIKWVTEATNATVAAHPVLTDGKALQARLELGLLYRKAKNDAVAYRQILDVIRAIDQMTEEDREMLNKVDGQLYRRAVREFARTCLLRGDKNTARMWSKKIKEGLPEKIR